MKKNIAFYISPVGRGHDIRCGVVIDTLLKLEEEIEIHVKSGEENITYLKKYLKADERLHFYEEEVDLGIVFDPALASPEWEATEHRISDYVDSWDDRAEAEKDFLISQDIGLVISDICPWIFLAADDLRVKSLLMADHTWDQIFEGHLLEEICDAYRECYELASKVFVYDVHHPAMESISADYENLSMMLRPHNMEIIEELGTKKDKPLVYLEIESGEEVKIGNVSCNFIVSSAMKVDGSNVTAVSQWPENTQNYIAACDYVIAGGSWNTLSEALLTNKKIALLPGKDMAQECAAASLLKERSQCIEIEESELQDMDGIIKRLDQLEYSYETEYHNDDYEAAKKILMVYPKKRRRKRT